jgi:hypothetical protein
METAEDNIGSSQAIVIGKCIGPVSICYVNLDNDKIRVVITVNCFDVLVLQFYVIIGSEVCGKRRQSERREKRIFDRTPEWALRFGK